MTDHQPTSQPAPRAVYDAPQELLDDFEDERWNGHLMVLMSWRGDLWEAFEDVTGVLALRGIHSDSTDEGYPIGEPRIVYADLEDCPEGDFPMGVVADAEQLHQIRRGLHLRYAAAATPEHARAATIADISSPATSEPATGIRTVGSLTADDLGSNVRVPGHDLDGRLIAVNHYRYEGTDPVTEVSFDDGGGKSIDGWDTPCEVSP